MKCEVLSVSLSGFNSGMMTYNYIENRYSDNGGIPAAIHAYIYRFNTTVIDIVLDEEKKLWWLNEIIIRHLGRLTWLG